MNLYIAQHPDSLPPEFRAAALSPEAMDAARTRSAIGMMMVETLDYALGCRSWRANEIAARNCTIRSWRPIFIPSGRGAIIRHRASGGPEPAAACSASRRTRTMKTTIARRHALAPHEDIRMNCARALGLADMRRMRTGFKQLGDCGPAHRKWKAAALERYAPFADSAEHLVHGRSAGAGLSRRRRHAAGFPFVIAGHNEHVAWGFTALYADVQDLYVEKLDGKGNYQAIDGSWKPLAVDHEVIHVRGGKDVDRRCAIDRARAAVESAVHQRNAADCAQVDALRSEPQHAADLRDDMASNWTEFSAALGHGAGRRRMSSTPTTRDTSRITRWARFRSVPRGFVDVPIHDSSA